MAQHHKLVGNRFVVVVDGWPGSGLDVVAAHDLEMVVLVMLDYDLDVVDASVVAGLTERLSSQHLDQGFGKTSDILPEGVVGHEDVAHVAAVDTARTPSCRTLATF